MKTENRLVSFEDDNSLIVNKISDFVFGESTEIIVHNSQSVFFVNNGVILEEFDAGKHILKSDKRSFLQKIFNRTDNMYHCEAYFINYANIIGIKWGTDSKIEYIEPTFNFPLSIGACGEMILSEMFFKAFTNTNKSSYIEVRQNFESEIEDGKQELEQEFIYSLYSEGLLVEQNTIVYEAEDNELSLSMSIKKREIINNLIFDVESKECKLLVHVTGNMGNENVNFYIQFQDGKYNYI